MKVFKELTRLALIALLVLACFGCDRKSKEQLLQEGLEFKEQKNLNGAIVLIKNALEKDPNFFEARHQLGLIYLAGGQYAKAEKELEKVLLQNPKDPSTQLQLAELHIRTGRYDAAIKLLEGYLQQQTSDSVACKLMGEAWVEKGNLVQGEEWLRRSLELDSAYHPARKTLARTYLRQGRLLEARELIAAVLAQDDKDLDCLYLQLSMEASVANLEAALTVGRRILEVAPQELRAAYFVGLLELQQGDLDAVEALAANIAAQHGDHPAGNRLLGLVALAKGDFDGAADKLQLSLRQMSDVPGRYFLGLAQYKAGHLEQALNQFQAVLDSNPDHENARLMVGLTLFQQKRYQDSQAAAQLLISANPRNAMAHDVLGSALLALGDFDRGMAALDRAVELNPALADAHLKKGLFSLSRQDFSKAEENLEEAVRIAPGALNARLLLVSSQLQRQNFSGAIATLKEGLQGQPADAVLYNYLAAAYLGQEQQEEAVAALQQAKRLKADYLAPYVNLANHYLVKGQPEKATEEYRSFLQVQPNNVRALLSLASLQDVQGDAEAAKASLQAARATGDKSAYLASVRFFRSKGDLAQALEMAQSGLERNAGDPALLMQQGQLLLQARRSEEALQTFRNLSQVQPQVGLPALVATLVAQGKVDEARQIAQGQIDEQVGEAFGYLLLADVHARQGDFNQGAEVLRQGLKRVGREGRKDLPLRMKLADYYQKGQQSDKAKTALEEIRNLYPDYVPALFSLGVLADGKGDKRQAKALYHAVLEKKPDYVPALNNLAYLYADNYGNLDEALRLAGQALRYRPADAGIMDTLGYVLVRQKHFAEALPYLQRAARALPKEALVQMHLGQAYAGLGQVVEARAALKKSLAGELGQAQVDQVNGLLRQLEEKVKERG
ncbi:MAG: PEP-CTERM system TPR-repeat protein PrsT [Syntrophotaleaceae bacterium]